VFQAGLPFTLTTSVGGTPVLTNAWYFNSTTELQNGGRISGAQSNVLTVANAQLSDSGTYQLTVTNGYGTSASTLATVDIVPSLGFNNLGGQWALNGTASYTGSNVLTLTTTIDQDSSSFFNYPVSITDFIATWTYQDVNANGPDTGADGACFVIQNNAAGSAAIGGGGGSLGVSGLTQSAELEFNIYTGNAYGGIGFGFATNGTLVNVTSPYPPIDIASGNPIYVTLAYVNGLVSLTLVETNDAGGNYTNSYTIPVNLPQTVGGNTAYVGFTGASGGTGSDQTVSDFNFVTYPALTAQPTGTGSIAFTWPIGDGAFTVLQSTSLTSPNWVPAVGTLIQTNNVDELIVTPSSAQVFYQLLLQ
jgi:hypothetical protein